jgi:hypothetical protein
VQGQVPAIVAFVRAVLLRDVPAWVWLTLLPWPIAAVAAVLARNGGHLALRVILGLATLVVVCPAMLVIAVLSATSRAAPTQPPPQPGPFDVTYLAWFGAVLIGTLWVSAGLLGAPFAPQSGPELRVSPDSALGASR